MCSSDLLKLLLAKHQKMLLGCAAILAFGASGAAMAQDMPETDPAVIAQLESDIDGSQSAEGALSMADSQAMAGDVSGSATTLERGLINFPDDYALRVRYVETLCMLDDAQAATFEYGKLVKMNVSPETTAQIDQVCAQTSISVH